MLHGETGYVVDPFNPVAIAARAVDLLSDLDRVRLMGEKGRPGSSASGAGRSPWPSCEVSWPDRHRTAAEPEGPDARAAGRSGRRDLRRRRSHAARAPDLGSGAVAEWWPICACPSSPIEGGWNPLVGIRRVVRDGGDLARAVAGRRDRALVPACRGCRPAAPGTQGCRPTAPLGLDRSPNSARAWGSATRRPSSAGSMRSRGRPRARSPAGLPSRTRLTGSLRHATDDRTTHGRADHLQHHHRRCRGRRDGGDRRPRVVPGVDRVGPGGRGADRVRGRRTARGGPLRSRCRRDQGHLHAVLRVGRRRTGPVDPRRGWSATRHGRLVHVGGTSRTAPPR